MGDGWNVAGFNALNQPVQMTSFFYEGTGNWMWFGYDPLGRCVKRWVGPGDGSAPNGATYLYYDGSNLIQEGPSATAVNRIYVHGGRVDEWSPMGRDDIDGRPEGRVSGRRANQFTAKCGDCLREVEEIRVLARATRRRRHRSRHEA